MGGGGGHWCWVLGGGVRGGWWVLVSVLGVGCSGIHAPYGLADGRGQLRHGGFGVLVQAQALDPLGLGGRLPVPLEGLPLHIRTYTCTHAHISTFIHIRTHTYTYARIST